MKKITLLFCFLAVSLGYSQTVLENFDGATAPTLAFSNGPGSATIVADPATGGTNGNVLEIITAAASAPWQQAELTLQGDYLDLSAAGSSFTMDVYSTVAFDMLARVTNGVTSSTNGTPVADSAADAIHTGTGWESLTFDFSNGETQDGLQVPTGIYGKIFLFNLWNAADTGTGAGSWNCGAPNCSIASQSWVDNISGIAATPPPTCSDGVQNGDETGIDCGGTVCVACAIPPTAAAPTPPARPAADVISFYSDAYTAHTIGNFDAGWCGGPAVTEVMIAGNPTQHYSGFACQGIDFSGNKIDASAFTTAHFDFYTSDTDIVGKVFNIKFVDFGGTGGEVAANTIEVNINDGTSPGVVTGSWVSVDFVLPQSLVTSLGDLAQIGVTSNLANVWYDNLYLHKGTTLSTEEFTAAQFKVFPNPTANNWNVESNTIIRSISVYDILGKQVETTFPNSTSVEINSTDLTSGMYFAKIVGENGTKTVKLIKE